MLMYRFLTVAGVASLLLVPPAKTAAQSTPARRSTPIRAVEPPAAPAPVLKVVAGPHVLVLRAEDRVIGKQLEVSTAVSPPHASRHRRLVDALRTSGQLQEISDLGVGFLARMIERNIKGFVGNHTGGSGGTRGANAGWSADGDGRMVG